MASSFGGSVKLTGESEYQKALRGISDNLKVLNSEMKTVTSQYDKNDKSAENLSSQNDVLNKKIEEQEQKVKVLNKALEDAKKETGDNSDTTKKWQTELNNAQADLNKLNRDLDTNKKTMQEAVQETKEEADAVEDFGKEADKSGDKALSMGDIIKANLISDAIVGGLSALGNAISGIGAKFSEFLALGEETKETQANWAKLESSFESAGLDIDYAADSMYELTGVLGDTGKATEASMLLSKMSKNGEDLATNTRILTGVFAEYGDSIPTEGLAEAMSATSAMGSVQGVLADALEWQGVNLDEYNEKLAKMSTEEERAAYIQQSLTDIYGASADAYREQNQALIESNEAQLRYEEWLATVGQLATPIQTNLKNMSSWMISGFLPALNSVTPGIENVSGSLEELIFAITGGRGEEAVAQATEGVKNGIMEILNGIQEALPQLTSMVSELLGVAIDLIADMAPVLIQEGAKLLGSLLSGISSNLGKILPVVLSVIESLLGMITQNLPSILSMGIEMLMSLVRGIASQLPMILSMGISMIVSLVEGISSMLPELIPLAIDAILNLTETLLDNIDLIIDAGILLIMSLADGLLSALPQLIDRIPVIIDKLVVAISSNMPKIIEMGIELQLQLAAGLIKAIPQLVAKIPQIITSLVEGFKNYWSKIGEVGKNLVSGIWEGISGSIDWIKNKIKGWVGDVTKFIKKLFGINSPSTVNLYCRCKIPELSGKPTSHKIWQSEPKAIQSIVRGNA